MLVPRSVGDGGVPTEDSAPACTGAISDELFAVDVLSASWFATSLTGGHAAFAYADAASIPTLAYASRADGAVKTVAVSKAIDARKYGTRMVALTHAHDRFALAFTTERTSSDGTTTGLQAIAFATVEPGNYLPVGWFVWEARDAGPAPPLISTTVDGKAKYPLWHFRARFTKKR